MKNKKYLHTEFVNFINEKYKSDINNEYDNEETNTNDNEIINDIDNEEDEVDNDDVDIIRNKKFPKYDELNVDDLIEEYNNLQKRYKTIYGSVYKRK